MVGTLVLPLCTERIECTRLLDPLQHPREARAHEWRECDREKGVLVRYDSTCASRASAEVKGGTFYSSVPHDIDLCVQAHQQLLQRKTELNSMLWTHLLPLSSCHPPALLIPSSATPPISSTFCGVPGGSARGVESEWGWTCVDQVFLLLLRYEVVDDLDVGVE